MISTSSASVLPKSLQLITNAWLTKLHLVYIHILIRIEISSNIEQRQYRLGLRSFEKQLSYSKVQILLISHYFALNFINFLL